MVSTIEYSYLAKQNGKLCTGFIWAMDDEQAEEILAEQNFTDIVL